MKHMLTPAELFRNTSALMHQASNTTEAIGGVCLQAAQTEPQYCSPQSSCTNDLHRELTQLLHYVDL